MRFDPRILRTVAGPNSFARGERYYLNGAVVDAHVRTISSGGMAVKGSVQGTREYTVSFRVSPDLKQVIGYECTCSFDGDGACKHVVALGLAAAEEPVEAPAVEDRLGETLAEAARKKQLDVSGEELGRLSKRLAALGVEAGRVAPRAREMLEERYPLDEIVLKLAYVRAKDRIELTAKAHYGPFVVMVGAAADPEPKRDGSVVHRVERNLQEEAICHRRLSGWPFSEDLRDGQLALSGDERVYWFVKNTLPRLQEEFRVEFDESFLPLLSIQQEAVEAGWETKLSSGIDFFEFSTDWHAGKTKLNLMQLKEMVRSWKPYIRAADGSFIECENKAEVERLLSFVDRAETTPNGTFRLRFFDAPELVAAIAESRYARLEATNAAFRSLLERTESGQPITPPVFPAHLKHTLRPYQKEGVAWGKFLQECHFGGILADDMGLGKTLQVLALLSVSKRRGPSLVVCPKTLVHVWIQEAAKFTPELRCVAVTGTPSERRALLAQAKADVFVTSYSLLQRDSKEYLRSGKSYFYCVLDEAQYVKNASTNSSKAVKLIRSDYRLALTGTPLENGLHELWSIFDFLMPGFLLDAKTFRSKFEKPIAEQKNKEALATLRQKVRPFMLRRTKESELKELPAKIEQTNLCELTPEQLILYTRTLEQVRDDVFRAVETKGFKESHIEILSALMRLRQICNHPALVDDRYPRTAAPSGKLEYALELVREATAGGHKVLLFSQFTSMLDIIRPLLDEMKIGHVTIEGKTKEREAEVRRFQNDPSVGVFLLSLKAGGTGLTLIEADTVILFDPWWNPMAERQAMDRAHRIGQKKTVNVYKLIAQATIEEKVLALQQRKRELFDAVMASGGDVELGKLTWDDLKGLFD